MKNKLVFLFTVISMFLYSQNIEILKKRTVLLVHSDIEDFYINTEEENFDQIIQRYNVLTLKSKGTFNCEYFRVNIKSDSCFLFLAYSLTHKRFYRLRGFKTNEFNEFYNLELQGGAVTFTENIKGRKKILKYILESVSIENLNLSALYNDYYNKPQSCLIDKSSCYRQSIIHNYKKK